MLPLTIVVFGATGDLFRKKLSRAFYDMSISGAFPEKFMLIGISRKHLSHVQFREFAAQAIGETVNQDALQVFLKNVYYYSLDATDKFAVESLRDILDQADRSHGACSDKLYYIATVPATYEDIFRNIASCGLGVPCVGGFKDQKAWIRIIVEKPFGTDAENAKMLDELLGESFLEDQIFRIDHYLAKETVQNIYSFRFRNVLFSPLWSRKYIEKVEIVCYEDETKDAVLERKKFYDHVGALRDVGQNHLLELLSLIAMEEPEDDESMNVRKNRASALADTRFSYDKDGDLVLGQYEGYATDTFSESKTETYFKARLSIENERWRNVPFWIEHGKAMSETRTEVMVHFKKTKDEAPNIIRFKIQPDAQICVEMSASGKTADEKKLMCFNLGTDNQFIYPYEKLLGDALCGDQTLFVSTGEVKEEWRITEEIQRHFKDTPLKIYQKGGTI